MINNSRRGRKKTLQKAPDRAGGRREKKRKILSGLEENGAG
jgi:hypothetical protein